MEIFNEKIMCSDCCEKEAVYKWNDDRLCKKCLEGILKYCKETNNEVNHEEIEEM